MKCDTSGSHGGQTALATATSFNPTLDCQRPRRRLEELGRGRPPRRGGIRQALFRLGVVLAVVLFSGAPGQAVDWVPEIAVRYPHVWRGITLREFPILAVSTTASMNNGLGFNAWVGLDLANDNERLGEVQEIDLEVHYRRSVGPVGFTLGYIQLIFPEGIDPTGEAYLHIQGPGPLAPRLEIHHNVDLLKDTFVLFHVQRRWDVSARSHLRWVGTVAYSGEEFSRFFDGSRAGWHHWGTTVDFSVGDDGRSTVLRLSYSDTLDAEVLPRQANRLWAGVYFRWSYSSGR